MSPVLSLYCLWQYDCMHTTPHSIMAWWCIPVFIASCSASEMRWIDIISRYYGHDFSLKYSKGFLGLVTSYKQGLVTLILLTTEVSVPGKICSYYYTHHATKLLGGILVSLRPSVRLAGHPASRVRSVAPTVLVGPFSYLYILSSNPRRCVACKVSC